MVNRNPAIVSGPAYGPCGRPLTCPGGDAAAKPRRSHSDCSVSGVRESAGRGDMDNDTDTQEDDSTRRAGAVAGTVWDPRADIDDDGDLDESDTVRV